MIWQCEKCKRKFKIRTDALKHEKNCKGYSVWIAIALLLLVGIGMWLYFDASSNEKHLKECLNVCDEGLNRCLNIDRTYDTSVSCNKNVESCINSCCIDNDCG